MINDRELVLAIVYTFIAFILLTVSILVFFYYSRKKIIQKEIEKKDLEITYQKEMLNAAILTQEKERKRIARDLHDDISSKINIISLNSHFLTAPSLSEIEIHEITSNIIEVSAKVLESTRRISHDLLPPIFEEFGIHVAIEELCCNYTKSKELIINYKNEYQQEIFNEIETKNHLHLFRIIQELVNNSIKHGHASKIDIVLEKKKNKRILKYTDNGKGFDLENSTAKKGLGMKNIESRVEFLNGNFKMNSAIDQGVQIHLNF
ncbi:MAG: two-component sensor histidine kinase [Flavobacterium sp.]|uniref:sensor histidine kinase n=1 Tax=Flavobacterium sp. TaxID=239 RepID=UPI000C61551B|nr:ATP-binding protein [Flavobacterium sp.]MBF02055.1 two-component sensor histidine kinase [Flavobacterium sp.]|tara:strand:+ start:930 stop:1718 length:789 start_codon:yes stop_codon:yes gene_type:complete